MPRIEPPAVQPIESDNCSCCQKLIAWLDANGINYDIVNLDIK